MAEPNEHRAIAFIILRTIASALVAYGVVQLLIGLLGPVLGVQAAAVFRTQGVLHTVAGIVVWLLAGPIAAFIARSSG